MKYTLQIRFHCDYNETVVKAHKPEKNYPMRTVVLTIGTPPCGISKHLVKTIQPLLNKNQHKIKSFVNKAQTWKMFPPKIQVSYVVNFYPSSPLDKAIDVIEKYLKMTLTTLK